MYDERLLHDPGHLHAVTSIGPSGAPTYTASYDAAGNMACRAPTTAPTCVGTPTGAALSFDTQGRLASWSGGTVTDSFLYDGAGNRVAQQVNVNGTNTTLTTYVNGGQEEVATTSGVSTLTKYFAGPSGLPTAERIGTNGALDYLASDGEGSVSAALDNNGNVTFQQLYTPYGSVRYTSGASPTAFGYTGQRADAATGLDFYHARYYDPVAQQFVSADSVQQGLSRYAYVGGNPETAIDPSGHLYFDPTGGGGGCSVNCGSGGSGSNGGGPGADPIPGPGGAGGGQSRPDNRANSPWYYRDDKAHLEAWIISLNPDPPDQHGVHYNLHIARIRGDELANFHIYYIGSQGNHYQWRAVDTFGKGGIRLNETFPLGFEFYWKKEGVYQAAFQAALDLGNIITKQYGFTGDGFTNHLDGLDEDIWQQFQEEWGGIINLFDRLVLLTKYPPAKF